MSVRQISQVFEHSHSTGIARLVLLALADVASDEGEVSAYRRSQSVLQKKANCDRRSVQRSLDQLEAAGEIHVTQMGDGRSSTDYRITLGEGRQDDTPGAAPRRPTHDEMPPQGRSDAAPIIPSSSVLGPSSSVSLAPKLELVVADGEREPTFDDFWRIYPRREGKGAARKSYEKALKLTTAQAILTAALTYRDLPGREPQFTKHPATWLNQECWDDDPVSRVAKTKQDLNRESLQRQVDDFTAGRSLSTLEKMRMVADPPNQHAIETSAR